MDDLRAMDLAGRELERRLAGLPADRMDEPSSLPGWSVFDLVNHVIGGGHRYLLLLRGATAEELAATRTEDHVGPDPLSSYLEWQLPLAAAFAEPGALDRVVHHPAGDRSGLELLRMRTLELALHGWDLARSLHHDDPLDEELCAHLAERATATVDGLRTRGLYGPPGDDDPALPAQVHLLRRTGRA